VFLLNLQYFLCYHVMANKVLYSATPRLVDLALTLQQRVDRAWSSNTRSRQKAGRKVRNTNYGAAVIDCKAR